jgi:drug/metabolite transporter (DMT)-like permease
MRSREPGQITAVLRNWKVAAVVGLSGMAASACWFTAMTIQNAAYVRALGQIELVFTFAASYFIFKEKSSRMELVGIGLVVAGIFVLLLNT